jgi:hypothetical protein
LFGSVTSLDIFQLNRRQKQINKRGKKERKDNEQDSTAVTLYTYVREMLYSIPARIPAVKFYQK